MDTRFLYFSHAMVLSMILYTYSVHTTDTTWDIDQDIQDSIKLLIGTIGFQFDTGIHLIELGLYSTNV